MAGWASIPAFIRPLVPIAIDATQLVYTLTAVIVKARGGKAWFSWLATTLFTAVSGAADRFSVPVRGVVDPAEVMALHAQGFSYAKIALRLGTNKTRVGRIVRGAAIVEITLGR